MRSAFVLLSRAIVFSSFAQLLPAPVSAESPTPTGTPSKSASTEAEKIEGHASITNRGISSPPNTATPIGRYEKIVRDAIGSKWYAYVEQRTDLMAVGTVRVSFWIDQNGRIKELKVVQNTSNEVFANVCLQSILDIRLPPIPAAVASTLPPKGLNEEISFVMFPK